MSKILKCQKHESIGQCEQCKKKNARLTYIELYGSLYCDKYLIELANIPVDDL